MPRNAATLNEVIRMQLAMRSLNRKTRPDLECECSVCKLIWFHICRAQRSNDDVAERRLVELLGQHEECGYHYDPFYN